VLRGHWYFFADVTTRLTGLPAAETRWANGAVRDEGDQKALWQMNVPADLSAG